MVEYSLTEAVAFLADIGPHVDKGLSGIRVLCVLLVVAMVVAVGAIVRRTASVKQRTSPIAFRNSTPHLSRWSLPSR